jgi:hypothetical protein
MTAWCVSGCHIYSALSTTCTLYGVWSAPEAALQRHQRHPAATLPVQPATALQRFLGCQRAATQRRHLMSAM